MREVLTSDLATSYKSVPRRSSKVVPRVMTQEKYNQLMTLMSVVQQAFAELQFSWVMNCGTLVGSFICHDILPWDDDLDILIKDTDLEQLETLQHSGNLTSKYGLKYTKNSYLQKIFFSKNKNIRQYKWSWPFIDLRVFKDKGEVVENDDRNKMHRYSVPHDWFFPLHMRPFGQLWLPSPRRPWHILSAMYGKDRSSFECYTAAWNHQLEKHRSFHPKCSCEALHGDYPFVFREPLGNRTLETLKLAHLTLYSVIVQEIPFENNQSPLSLPYLKTTDLISLTHKQIRH